MHITRLWLLPAAPALLAGIAHALTSDDDATAEGTTTVATVTVSITRSVTLTRIAAASPAPHEMTVGAREYRLQGCFGQGGLGTVGLVLGTDYIGAAGAGNTTLSLCLGLCASAVTRSNETYAYVGVAGGDSCYCGTALDPTAPRAPANDCTLPCRGDDTEACGGRNLVSEYKLVSHHATAQTKSAGGGDTFSKGNSTDNGTTASTNQTVTAGIAVGSVSGFVMLLFLVFLGVRWYGRRRQAQAEVVGERQRVNCSTSTTGADTTVVNTTRGKTSTDSTITTQDEKTAFCDATRVDLQGLDDVVTDKHSSLQIGVAATTGAEWRSSSGDSPLTPRTPRTAHATGMPAGDDNVPTTPSIMVHPPDDVAPTHGLGGRAWHRRRPSVPFPPAGHDGAAAAGGGEGRDDRRALPSQVSGSHPPREPPVRYEVDEAASAMSEEGPRASSPSWRRIMSTESGASATREGGARSGKAE